MAKDPVTGKDDDDDLEIEIVRNEAFEPGETEPEQIEPAPYKPPVAETVPEEDEDEVGDNQLRRKGAEGEGEGELEPGPSLAERDEEIRRHYENQVAEKEMVFRANLAAAEQRNAEIQRDALTMALQSLDAKIDIAKHAVARADETGSALEKLEAEQLWNELRNARGQVIDAMGRIPDPQQLMAQARHQIEQIRNGQGQQQAQRGPRGVKATPGNDLANRWITQNAWIQQAGHETERAYLLQINEQLVREGFNPKTAEFYNETSRRMGRAFPSHGVKNLAGVVTGRPGQRRGGAPVANPRTAAKRSEMSTANRVVLTDSDFKNMRRFGLDPENKRVQKYYAKSKRDRLLAEANI
jgi:hypothetical protein